MKKVNLKKASELARMAIEAARDAEVKTTARVTTFDRGVVMASLETARDDMLEQAEQPIALLTVGYNIRKMLAHANVSSGVSDILTDIALLDARIARYAKVTDDITLYGVSDDSFDVIAEKISYSIQLREQQLEGKSVGANANANETITASLVTSEVREQFSRSVAALKLERTDLRDQLAALNAKETVELTDEMVSVLQSYGLMA